MTKLTIALPQRGIEGSGGNTLDFHRPHGSLSARDLFENKHFAILSTQRKGQQAYQQQNQNEWEEFQSAREPFQWLNGSLPLGRWDLGRSLVRSFHTENRHALEHQLAWGIVPGFQPNKLGFAPWHGRAGIHTGQRDNP